MDLTALTDAELAALLSDLAREQDRRANLGTIPAQVGDLAKAYKAGGGDPTELHEAITAVTTPPAQ